MVTLYILFITCPLRRIKPTNVTLSKNAGWFSGQPLLVLKLVLIMVVACVCLMQQPDPRYLNRFPGRLTLNTGPNSSTGDKLTVLQGEEYLAWRTPETPSPPSVASSSFLQQEDQLWGKIHCK